MADAIERTQEELTTALDAFERGRAALFRPDGSPKYSDAEHAERLATLTQTLHGVAERVDAAVDAELATVRRAEEAEHDDPTMHLTPTELQLSNARAQFVREDAMGLPLPALLTRLRGIVAAGGDRPDRVQSFLWSRYAHQRLLSEVETARAGGGRLDGTTRDQVAAIETEVAKLVAVVAPTSAISKAEAERRMRRARAALSDTHARVGQADGSFERISRDMAATGRYTL